MGIILANLIHLLGRVLLKEKLNLYYRLSDTLDSYYTDARKKARELGLSDGDLPQLKEFKREINRRTDYKLDTMQDYLSTRQTIIIPVVATFVPLCVSLSFFFLPTIHES